MRGNERPIIIRKVKKIAGGHHGGAWKVAYADFVTAMMAFFMLLWLISNPDRQRLKGLAEYFSPSAPSSSPATTLSSDPGEQPGQGGRTRRAQADRNSQTTGQVSMESATHGTARGGTAQVPDASMRVLAAELRVAIDSMPQSTSGQNNLDIQQTRDGLRITLMDTDRQSMFRAGTAQLNGYARAMLDRVAEKLATSSAQIAIEGHTDGAGGQSDANWRLSGERALAARTALLASGLPADRFSEIVAMGATRPVYPDQPNRPENRRITIILKGEAPSLPSDASFRF